MFVGLQVGGVGGVGAKGMVEGHNSYKRIRGAIAI